MSYLHGKYDYITAMHIERPEKYYLSRNKVHKIEEIINTFNENGDVSYTPGNNVKSVKQLCTFCP